MNDEQFKVFDAFLKGKSIFLTGCAGSGKSFVIKYITDFCKSSKIKYGLTATTGVSAILINGVTIHSFMRIFLGDGDINDWFINLKKKCNYAKFLELYKLELLIIDEISMMNPGLFEKISKYMSLVKNNNKPFGGIQLIIAGDFLQIPPVKCDNFCFQTKTWIELNLEVFELKNQMRQNGDEKYKRILSDMRDGIVTDESYFILESKIIHSSLEYDNEENKVLPTILYTTNINVDQENKRLNEKLINKNNKSKIYNPIYNKTIKGIEQWLEQSGVDKNGPEFTVGSQVMITYNIDVLEGVANGTRGVVTHLNEKGVEVKLMDRRIVHINYLARSHEQFAYNKYAVSYLPLKLAFAITIHKSQGLSLDYIRVDVGKNIFEYNQAYTALSRCRSLDGLEIIDLSIDSLKLINLDVLEFYKKLN